MTGLPELVAAWVADPRRPTAPMLAALHKAAAGGKENGGKAARDAALQCFKACQAALAAPGATGDAVAAAAAVGRAALAALAATSPSSATAQLAGWRYNFARRLVACKDFGDAHAEAALLFAALRDQPAGGGEAASLAVGTALTLVLCCVEGKLLGDAAAVGGLLDAARALPRWLSQLPEEEAGRHGEAAFKYLYKAAATLLERKAWQQLPAVCGAMLAAAGGDAAAQRRAAAAIGKLAGHAPEEQAAALLGAAAEAAAASNTQLSSAVALDLLGLLCSAAQRAESAGTRQQLQQAVTTCAASPHKLLQTATLLLPALALGGGSSAGADWPQRVSAAAERLSSSSAQLEGQQGPAAQAHLSVLEAAFLSANAVRRVIAPQLGSSDAGSGGASKCVQAIGGAAAASAAAAVLELLAAAVGAASRHALDSSLAGQGHAAAVALATAARLHAAAGGELMRRLQPAARSLLGWDLQTYCGGSSELPPAATPLEPQELGWLASALFNVGVDLHGCKQYAAAAEAMQAALVPAVASLQTAMDAGSSSEVLEGRVADFCRKCVALSDAQQRAGDSCAALTGLGHCTALLLQLGFHDPAAWQPLVQAFVRLQAEQPAPASQPAAASSAQPARRGRGATSKKAAAAPEAPPSSTSSAPLLVDCLQAHAEQLPGGSLAAVVEHELQSWASQPSGSSSVGQLARRLLQDAFSPSQQPVQHAGVLLALHQLGLPGDDGGSGSDLLERAAAVLDRASCPGAASMMARVRCAQALEAARGLARQALQEQQQERQCSHAAASTSAASSVDQDAAAVGQLAEAQQADAAAWQRVRRQAQQAVAVLEAAGGHSDVGSQTHAAFQELAWMLGLQGSQAAEEQLSIMLPAEAGAEAGGVLAALVFPGARGTPAELEQAAAAAAAECGRSGSAVVRRAALHTAAAEAHAAAGGMVPALFHASEAHRLLAVLFHAEDSSSSGTISCTAAVSWWRLTGAYLGSLLQLGQLFEAAGLADEALHALREAQRLAVAAGACPAAALCGARLAEIYCRQGQLPAAQQAVAGGEQQLAVLEAPSGSASLAQLYCRAAVQVARAQLGCSGGSGGAKACQAAVACCRELVAAAAELGGQQAAWCSALLAAALLQTAEAAAQQGNQPSAMQHAADALAVAAGAGESCSAGRHMQAAALLFLGQHAAPPADSDQHLAVWGLCQPNAASAAVVEASAAKGRGRKAPARQPASRGRSKAAAAASDDASCSAGALQQPHLQHLWHALELSKGQLGSHRAAAAALAEACGRHGYLHLAAWLLQTSLGAAMRLQYQLVLHSRRQQLAQRARRGLLGADAQPEQLEQLSAVLHLGLDWQLVACLAGSSSSSSSEAVPAPARGRKGGAAKAAAAASSGDPAAALAALEHQAAQQLHSWQDALPSGTATCSVSVLPSSGGSSLLVCRLPPADAAALPPLVVALPVQQLSASLSQHPIRALQMDEDAGMGEAVSSVQSVLEEMAGVLADSGRSMRELATDTKEQQREWWRARLALEDRLAALVRHLDSSWLGPWRCLLLGEPLSGGSQAGEALACRLLELREAAGQPASPQQAGVLRHAAAVLARHAHIAASSGDAGMSPSELRQAVHQLCSAAGLACNQGQQHELEALLSAAAPLERAAATAVAAAADADMAEGTAAAPVKAGKGRRAGGKSVKFADDVEAEPPQPQQQPEPPAPASRAASKGRTPAASRSRRGAAAAAAAAEQAAASSSGGDTSPVATLGSLEGGAADEAPQTVAQSGLCQVFDSLHLEDVPTGTAATGAPGTAAKAAGTTTARSGKHRSRLRMMQAGTPGPATARKSAAAAAATAPRPAREVPLTVAKSAPPAAARPGSSDADVAAAAEAAAPVLLVLDGALQALPWESAPGLLRQRLYRMPSLACAAASAHRASSSVDLSSTFYALNPSGDLADTQSAFQDWFSGMRGWQGKAGSAPSAAELAEALTSRQLFLYCGHGGGEQYISAAKLRSLERCSAALLMGCSSGRLRAQRSYEPSGVVLAYLLAGCPAAVANLWDVTDRDIDRFSQAVLTAWISGAGSNGSSGDSSSSGGSSAAAGTDVCAAVAASRGACKLPHLVGAAPVCYGIPSRIVASEA